MDIVHQLVQLELHRSESGYGLAVELYDGHRPSRSNSNSAAVPCYCIGRAKTLSCARPLCKCSASFSPSLYERSEREISKLSKLKLQRYWNSKPTEFIIWAASLLKLLVDGNYYWAFASKSNVNQERSFFILVTSLCHIWPSTVSVSCNFIEKSMMILVVVVVPACVASFKFNFMN